MKRDIIQKAIDAVLTRLEEPQAAGAFVLGSGWCGALQDMQVLQDISYTDVPLLAGLDVEGHTGRLLVIETCGNKFLVFEGRRHWYEGLGWEPVVFPVYLAQACGAHTVVLTNAAGGLNPDYEAGALMLLSDHINWMGSNPLIGSHDSARGTRFPDQSDVYTASLRQSVLATASEQGLSVREGVYAAAPGPAYETPAEIRAFRTMGADAVGMSTVPEAMVANWMGLWCLAVSCITNQTDSGPAQPLSHEEVLAVADRNGPRMRQLLQIVCSEIVKA